MLQLASQDKLSRPISEGDKLAQELKVVEHDIKEKKKELKLVSFCVSITFRKFYT